MSSCRQHKWCCQDGSNLTSCCGDETTFNLGLASPVAVLVASASASAISPSSNILESSIEPTMVTQPASTTAETGSSNPDQPTMATSSATLPISNAAVSRPPSSPSGKPSSAVLGLSIGLVGVFVGITLFSARAYILHSKYRRQQKKRHQHSDVKAQSHQPSNSAPIGRPNVELEPTSWELAAGPSAGELPDHKISAAR